MAGTDLPWTDAADVVVVGGGGGGMAAAISAAEADPDADVLVLQKIDSLGGSTTMAVGGFAAAGTRLQEAAGVPDSADAHFEDIDKLVDEYAEGAGRTFYFDFEGDLHAKDDRELRRLMVEEGAATLAWLRGMGCEYTGPYPDPPNRVPRVHAIAPDATAYADVLGERMDELGVEVRFGVEAYELVEDGGEVRGVLADRAEAPAPLVVEARRGVVLATGDYVNSPELRREHTSNAEADPVNEHNTGDGFRMAAAAGAEWVNMDVQRLTLRFGDPLWTAPAVPALVDEGAVLVDAEGRRFVDETVDYDQLFSSALDRPGGRIYAVFGRRVARTFSGWPHSVSTWPGKGWGYIDDYRGTDVLHRAGDLPGLADRIGADPDALVGAVEGFDAAAGGEAIDAFGRTGTDGAIEPPYHALGPIRPYSVITEGGIDVDPRLRALDGAGEPIGGLFAAGSIAGGLHLVGHGHHHSWTFTSGRIAGRGAAGASAPG